MATPTRRHHLAERPTKRTRLSSVESRLPCASEDRPAPCTPLQRRSPAASHSRVNSHLKRKRGAATPSSCRKRRRSSSDHIDAQNGASVTSKKFRIFKPDVEMRDAATATPKETPSKKARRKILKQVLRSEKISRSALRNLSVNDVHAAPPRHAAPMSHSVASTPYTEHTSQTSCLQLYPTDSAPEESVVLTGEELVEEVDISLCSETEKQYIHDRERDEQNPVQAHLMGDGRCFVRIVRSDGAVDYYTLHPHNEAREHYYEQHSY
ncbi:unnamed protein product [Agarophyton chilense]